MKESERGREGAAESDVVSASPSLPSPPLPLSFFSSLLIPLAALEEHLPASGAGGSAKPRGGDAQQPDSPPPPGRDAEARRAAAVHLVHGRHHAASCSSWRRSPACS